MAVLTILTLLFLTGLFQYLPEATLAAVVIVAVAELIDIAAMVRLYRSVTGPLRAIYGAAARADFIAALCALLGVLIFDTLPGLFIGIAVSVFLIVYRASRPHVAELGAIPHQPGRYVDLQRNPEAVPVVGLVILRVESELFFANAETVRDTIRSGAKKSGTNTVILDVEAVPAIDVTAARMLIDLVDDLARTG